ncbi:MAG: hypothetical protein KF821_09475 [Anaerolineales bacterium]|jgi:hypothetical protein|nr:hypothetical protein [Anaerolineales bacterium]MBX3006038.1 hypothetical protein [Anaerolineales bacterium]MCW5838978.1 hypothetical protein [Anaerolineales bacterium]
MTWIDTFFEHNPELAGRVTQRSAHATHFALAGGLRRAVVTTAPQYFRGPHGWQSYDLNLRPDAAARWGAAGSPVRLAPDGSLSVGSYAQRTYSVGVWAQAGYTALAQLPAVARAAGTRLRREQGVFCHELLLTENGVKEELRIAAMPALESRAGYLVYATRRQGTPQGLQFTPGHALDAAGRVLAVHHFEDGELHYTGLALEDLAAASFPVVIDPLIAFGALGDGFVAGQHSTYDGARLNSSLYDSGGADLFVGQAYEASLPRYHAYRGFVKFSLASLNPMAQIYAATLGLACVVDASTLSDFDVQIVAQDWSAQDPLSNGNREAAYDGCRTGSLAALWRNTAGVATNSLLSSAPLDVSGLLPGGMAYYSLRSSRDAGANPPPANGAEYVRLAAAAHSNPALRPALVVDYFAVPSAVMRSAQPTPQVRIQDTRLKLRARRRKTLLHTVRLR